MQGCHHSAPNKDTRLPITGPIIHKLVKSLQTSVQNLNYRVLLKAIFLLAFNAFLRLGEVMVKSKCLLGTVIQREDVSLEFCGKSHSAVVILLKNFKTNKKKICSKFISKHQEIVTCAQFWHCTNILKPLVIFLDPFSNSWEAIQFLMHLYQNIYKAQFCKVV